MKIGRKNLLRVACLVAVAPILLMLSLLWGRGHVSIYNIADTNNMETDDLAPPAAVNSTEMKKVVSVLVDKEASIFLLRPLSLLNISSEYLVESIERTIDRSVVSFGLLDDNFDTIVLALKARVGGTISRGNNYLYTKYARHRSKENQSFFTGLHIVKALPAESAAYFGVENAFDDYHFTPTETFGWLSVPKDPKAFMLAQNFSRYMPCNYQRALDTRVKFREGAAQKSLREQFNLVMYDVKKTFLQYGMVFWLGSGTLLGWYRQCDVIPESQDGDGFVWADEMNLAIKEELSKEDRDVKLIWELGMPDNHYQFGVGGFDFKTDVFFLYSNRSRSWFGEHIWDSGDLYRHTYDFPRSAVTLCSSELLGFLHTVPCEENVLRTMLLAEYGENYTIPNRDDWYQERPNMVYHLTFQSTLWPDIYRMKSMDDPKQPLEKVNKGQFVMSEKKERRTVQIDW